MVQARCLPTVRVDADREDTPREEVEEPARLVRIASTVQTLLHEVQTTELDQAARERLTGIHDRIVDELGDVVSTDLARELRELSLEPGEETPTGAELRVMQAQLAGWLQGLSHGIQASIATQRIAARQQLEGRHAQQGGELPRGESGQDL